MSLIHIEMGLSFPLWKMLKLMLSKNTFSKSAVETIPSNSAKYTTTTVQSPRKTWVLDQDQEREDY